MAKSNKSIQIFSVCTIALAVVGLVFYMFLDAIKGTHDVLSYNGMQAMFGVEDELKFSFALFLGFIFAIAGIVITILPMAGVKFKLFPVIALACFVVAALFAFLTAACVQPVGLVKLAEFKLAVGSILAGILYICAACTSALPVVLKK